MCRGGYVKPWYPIVLCDHVVFLLPVHPVAPANLTAVAHAWNATLLWDWEYAAYAPLALACQVEITLDGHVKKVTARARVCVCFEHSQDRFQHRKFRSCAVCITFGVQSQFLSWRFDRVQKQTQTTEISADIHLGGAF